MKRYALTFLTLLVIAGLFLSVACVAPAPSGEVTPSTEEKPSEEAKPPSLPEELTEEAKSPPLTEVKPTEPPAEPEELPSLPLTIVDDLGKECVGTCNLVAQ